MQASGAETSVQASSSEDVEREVHAMIIILELININIFFILIKSLGTYLKGFKLEDLFMKTFVHSFLFSLT